LFVHLLSQAWLVYSSLDFIGGYWIRWTSMQESSLAIEAFLQKPRSSETLLGHIVQRLLSLDACLDHAQKTVEEVLVVAWPGRRFRVVLDTHDGK